MIPILKIDKRPISKTARVDLVRTKGSKTNFSTWGSWSSNPSQISSFLTSSQGRGSIRPGRGLIPNLNLCSRRQKKKDWLHLCQVRQALHLSDQTRKIKKNSQKACLQSADRAVNSEKLRLKCAKTHTAVPTIFRKRSPKRSWIPKDWSNSLRRGKKILNIRQRESYRFRAEMGFNPLMEGTIIYDLNETRMESSSVSHISTIATRKTKTKLSRAILKSSIATRQLHYSLPKQLVRGIETTRAILARPMTQKTQCSASRLPYLQLSTSPTSIPKRIKRETASKTVASIIKSYDENYNRRYIIKTWRLCWELARPSPRNWLLGSNQRSSHRKNLKWIRRLKTKTPSFRSNKAVPKTKPSLPEIFWREMSTAKSTSR